LKIAGLLEHAEVQCKQCVGVVHWPGQQQGTLVKRPKNVNRHHPSTPSNLPVQYEIEKRKWRQGKQSRPLESTKGGKLIVKNRLQKVKGQNSERLKSRKG